MYAYNSKKSVVPFWYYVLILLFAISVLVCSFFVGVTDTAKINGVTNTAKINGVTNTAKKSYTSGILREVDVSGYSFLSSPMYYPVPLTDQFGYSSTVGIYSSGSTAFLGVAFNVLPYVLPNGNVDISTLRFKFVNTSGFPYLISSNSIAAVSSYMFPDFSSTAGSSFNSDNNSTENYVSVVQEKTTGFAIVRDNMGSYYRGVSVFFIYFDNGFSFTDVTRLKIGQYSDWSVYPFASDIDGINKVSDTNLIIQQYVTIDGKNFYFIIPTSLRQSGFFSPREYVLPNGLTLIENSSYQTGFNAGQSQGREIGYINGKHEGYINGRDEGYDLGYDAGYSDGMNVSDTYSFLNFFSAIIDAPVQVFTKMFDFEIFGLNISTFFLSLLTVCVVIVVVRWIAT